MMNRYNILKRLSVALYWPSVGLVLYLIYLTFLVVPNEVRMGPVQRIFYFHLGAAIAAYCAVGVLLVGSLVYLGNRSVVADIIASAGAEVALLFCSLVLASGMIWGHSAWNTWFSWEPRLVSFLLLWLLLLAYGVLRKFGDPSRVSAHCAVLGIIGAVNVPIIVYSIKLLPQMTQVHPQVVENQGLKDPRFVTAMFVGMGALVLFQFFLVVFRSRIGLLELDLAQREQS